MPSLTVLSAPHSPYVTHPLRLPDLGVLPYSCPAPPPAPAAASHCLSNPASSVCSWGSTTSPSPGTSHRGSAVFTTPFGSSASLPTMPRFMTDRPSHQQLQAHARQETTLYSLLTSERDVEIPAAYLQRLVRRVLERLAEIHASGKAHGAVSPAVVRLHGRGGHVTLLDASRSIAEPFAHRYHAPECLVSGTVESAPADLWAAGCVVAELLLGRPLHNERGWLQHIRRIAVLAVASDPSAAADLPPLFAHVPGVLTYLEDIGTHATTTPLRRMFPPDTDPDAIDLIVGLLQLAPGRRTTAAEALRHPYLAEEKHQELTEAEARRRTLHRLGILPPLAS